MSLGVRGTAETTGLLGVGGTAGTTVSLGVGGTAGTTVLLGWDTVWGSGEAAAGVIGEAAQGVEDGFA